jgi:hypothetical protein
VGGGQGGTLAVTSFPDEEPAAAQLQLDEVDLLAGLILV